jgi:hypothetical protein
MRLPAGPNSIEWTYEAGTPTFVNIQLLHKNNESLPPIPNLLTSDGIFATGIDITSGVIIFSPSW